MLNKYLNDKTLENIDKYSKKFQNNTPFNHISIENFLTKEIAEKILENLEKEEYYLEDHDLYQFKRTIDLKNSKNNFILEFRDFLKSKEFIDFIEKLTNTKIDPNQIDLHSLFLENTHYLLCHDDDVKDRSIAFIINLSKDWKEEYGGELELYESKNNLPTIVSKKVIPNFNQFNAFKVTPGKSFHQVNEIIGDHKRISISGWYYNKK